MYKFKLIAKLTTLIVGVCLLNSTFSSAAAKDAAEILSKYKPVAMDESIRVLSNPDLDFALPEDDSKLLKKDELLLDNQLGPSSSSSSSDRVMNLLEPEVASNSLDDILRSQEEPSDISLLEIPNSTDRIGSRRPMKNRMPNHKMREDAPPLVEVKDSSGKNISETLFNMPKENTSKLTKLITGKEEPTFVQPKINKPTFHKQTQNSNILASYRIFVPILIPAVKTNGNKIKQNLPRDDVEYVKETHTKMVPIHNQVPRVKTILKAERVPQKIVTDFVMADGQTVPSSVDDKLKPNEHLIKTVVTNFD